MRKYAREVGTPGGLGGGSAAQDDADGQPPWEQLNGTSDVSRADVPPAPSCRVASEYSLHPAQTGVWCDGDLASECSARARSQA